MNSTYPNLGEELKRERNSLAREISKSMNARTCVTYALNRLGQVLTEGLCEEEMTKEDIMDSLLDVQRYLGESLIYMSISGRPIIRNESKEGNEA